MKLVLPVIAVSLMLCFLACQKKSGKGQEARQELEQWHQEAYLIISKEQIDRYDEADSLLKRIIDRDPSPLIAIHNLLYLNSVRAQWDAFCELQFELEKQMPDEPVLLMKSGMCLERELDSVQAHQKYTRAEMLFREKIKQLVTNDPLWKSVSLTRILNLKLLKNQQGLDSIRKNLPAFLTSSDSALFERQINMSRRLVFRYLAPETAIDPAQK